MANVRPPVFPVVNRHLRSVLGWSRFLFLIRLLFAVPQYRRRFFRPDDSEDMQAFNQQFLLAGALYHELVPLLGEQQAFAVVFRILSEIAIAVQRAWYIPPASVARSWEAFHQGHHSQMQHDLIRFNERDEIEATPEREAFHITRCQFFETFSAMGVPGLTEAFCRSDETVFNEYSPELRFHRGDSPENTIARGGSRCAFIFERVRPSRTGY